MQTWPALRNLQRTAPATAASRSASSKTRNGALPPSSSESFLTCPAHCAISSLPTAVEPVKPILRTVGLPVSSPPIAGASSASPVTTWKTPAGMPARSASSASASAESGVCSAGLHTIVLPAAERGRGLARDHRRGEVPGRDAAADADRLLEHDDARAGLLGRDRVAVDALGLLAHPLEEGRRVADLGIRLGQRLALLARHDHRQVAAVAEHEVGEGAQDTPRARARGARARRAARPRRPRSRAASRRRPCAAPRRAPRPSPDRARGRSRRSRPAAQAPSM